MLSTLCIARQQSHLTRSFLSARTQAARCLSSSSSSRNTSDALATAADLEADGGSSSKVTRSQRVKPTDEELEQYKKLGWIIKPRRTAEEKKAGVLTAFEAARKLRSITFREAKEVREAQAAKRSKKKQRVLWEHWNVKPSNPIAKLPPLPAQEHWVDIFPSKILSLRDRVQIHNPHTAMEVAKSFMEGEGTRSDQAKVIIEAFPGPGMLSRALLTYPPSKLKKLIILESAPQFLEHLKPLAQADSRVTIVSRSGYQWDTYSKLIEEGLLDDVEMLPWEAGVHPTLHFISHVTMHVHGDQLVSQFFRHIPRRSWLFNYGRVPMSFLMNDFFYRRLSSPPNEPERCKVGVFADATSELRLALPFEALQPFGEHLHPDREMSLMTERKREARRVGAPFVAVNAIPRAEQVITKDELGFWDYVLRKVFVSKATPLSSSVGLIAPGAHHLLKYINEDIPQEEQVDYSKDARQLTVQDWTHVVRAFADWPFKPEDLAIDAYLHVDED